MNTNLVTRLISRQHFLKISVLSAAVLLSACAMPSARPAASSAAQTTQKLFDEMDAQRWDNALALLADDFQFSGPVPQPLSKQQWVGVVQALAAAMPDFKHNFKFITAAGDTIEGEVGLTGKQTKELQLPIPNTPKLPASGKSLALPKEHMTVTVRDGKIISIKVESVQGGGVPGILQQLGA